MIRMLKNFMIGLLLIMLNSCLTINDSWIDLGDNYTYHVDGRWKSIYPSQVYYNTAIYSEIVDYNYNDKYIIAKQIPDYEHHLTFIGSNYSTRYAIYCNFLKDSTSENFMEDTNPFIRKSIKADSSLYKLLKSKGVTDQNLIRDRENIKFVLDSTFQVDSFYVKLFTSTANYWIIDKDINERFGPLTESEFEIELKSMNIGLVLNSK